MKGRLIFSLAIVVFLALVPLVYWNLFEHGLSVSQPIGQVPKAPAELKVELLNDEIAEPAPIAMSVTEINGKVEIKSDSQQGWKSAEVGVVLGASDRIRTMLGSQATLSMPGVFSVRLREESDFKVRKLADNAFKFLLKEGMISADVIQDSERIFEVSSDRNVVASTNGASFSMNVSHSGLVSLGTTSGEVAVASMGKVVKIKNGYQVQVQNGKPPADPIKIPNKLFLRVRWPKKRDLSRKNIVVSGETNPGSRVNVSGVVVEVDSKGRFKTVVALREGKNRLKVEVESLDGRKKQKRSPAIRVDTKADRFQIRTSPEMWEKKP
jgi:hypothetical protein